MTAPRHLRTVPAVAQQALRPCLSLHPRPAGRVGVVARQRRSYYLEMLEFQYDHLHFNDLSG
jgi:hypothetical protein